MLEKNIERIANSLEKISGSLEKIAKLESKKEPCSKKAVQPEPVEHEAEKPVENIEPDTPLLEEEKPVAEKRTARKVATKNPERAAIMDRLKELGIKVNAQMSTAYMRKLLEKHDPGVEKPEIPPQEVSLDSLREELKNFAMKNGQDNARKLVAAYNVAKISDLTMEQRVDLSSKLK